MDSLLKDAPRFGRKSAISAEKVAQVIAMTTQSKPATATHSSRSTMAREAGISDSSVGRFWRAHGLKPHRVESYSSVICCPRASISRLPMNSDEVKVGESKNVWIEHIAVVITWDAGLNQFHG